MTPRGNSYSILVKGSCFQTTGTWLWTGRTWSWTFVNGPDQDNRECRAPANAKVLGKVPPRCDWLSAGGLPPGPRTQPRGSSYLASIPEGESFHCHPIQQGGPCTESSVKWVSDPLRPSQGLSWKLCPVCGHKPVWNWQWFRFCLRFLFFVKSWSAFFWCPLEGTVYMCTGEPERRSDHLPPANTPVKKTRTKTSPYMCYNQTYGHTHTQTHKSWHT